MSGLLERGPGETVPEFAARMSDLVRLIHGIVQSHAGMGVDMDDVLDDLDFILEHVADDDWEECWQLRVDIQRVISRMTDIERLRRILYFAQERSK